MLPCMFGLWLENPILARASLCTDINICPYMVRDWSSLVALPPSRQWAGQSKAAVVAGGG